MYIHIHMGRVHTHSPTRAHRSTCATSSSPAAPSLKPLQPPRGVQNTVLFPLCHANNAKPNCPPILLVNLHLFRYFLAFLSLCAVRFIHPPGTNDISRLGLSLPTQERTEGIYSL